MGTYDFVPIGHPGQVRASNPGGLELDALGSQNSGDYSPYLCNNNYIYYIGRPRLPVPVA